MRKYNTPHRRRVIKTRLTEEEYTEFSERVSLCKMSQSEYIRQALIKSSIRPVITVSPVNDELLSAVGKLTAEYGKIGGKPLYAPTRTGITTAEISMCIS